MMFASFSTPQPYRSEHACPKCGRSLGTADIHTLALGAARKAWYTCAACGFEWQQVWRSVDRSERVTADELLAVHEALGDFEGPLTDLLRTTP